MNFVSLTYFIFLIIAFAVYWAVPHSFRKYIIVASGCVFYMWAKPICILLLIADTVVCYFAGLWIDQAKEDRQKKQRMTYSVVFFLAILFVFKYLDFAIGSINWLQEKLGFQTSFTTVHVLLPVGISFYTFQIIAYLADIRHGRIGVEKDFWTYAAFVCFFPQILSGPIPRAKDLLPQIKESKTFDSKLAMDGVKLATWGYFKKAVIADLFGIYVDKVYVDTGSFTGFACLLVIFLYSFQIYFDFSGYTDIARGSAQLFGICLGENFRQPYFSKSVNEFWDRWHISLSTWLRDYVYIHSLSES